MSAKFHSNNVSPKDQNTQTVPSHVKTPIALFEGDSIPTKNKPLHDRAEVLGLPGGTIKSMMEQLKSNGKDYGRIVLLVVTNDCASTQTIEEITESYKQLIDEALLHCPNGLLTVSALCPRKDNDQAQDNIERLNRKLELRGTYLACSFISNHQSFYLQDGSIKDGYLDEKGLHLSKAGMKRLIDILVLKYLLFYDEQPRSLHKSMYPQSNYWHETREDQQTISGHNIRHRIANQTPKIM